MRKASRVLEKLNFVRGEKVLAHVGGPSGAGKTELVNVLTPRVRNITLIDLDQFDDEAVEKMGLQNVPKNDYTNAMLRQHHIIKQQILNRFVQTNRKPVVFFGHVEEAGNVLKIPTSVRILLSTSPTTSSMRRGKAHELSPQEIRDMIQRGEEDVKYFKGQGYIPMTARQIYATILSWSKELG